MRPEDAAASRAQPAPHVVPKGYKQTELGVIPEGWETVSIQQLIEGGSVVGHLDGNHGELYPRSHEFKESGVPYITANDLKGHEVDFSHCKYLSQERAATFRKGIARSGDVLFAHNATVGPTALLSTDLDYVILSTTATYYRCNPNKLNNSFLLYSLQSPLFVWQYQAIMSQSTRNQVPITAQRKLSIILPPTLAEQEAIAEALSDADALIEGLESLIAKKRAIKQGAMQELITDKRRLPGFEGEWVEKTIGDICRIEMGRTPPRLIKSYWGSGYKWLSIADLNSKVITESKEEITKLAASTMTIVPKGTLIMSFKLSLGRLGFAGCDLFTNEAICSFNNMSESAGFLYYVLGRTDFSLYGKQAVKGYTLNKESLNSIQIRLPSLDEQSAISAVLSDMDDEIAALEGKLTKARQVKQGMMQELLTGRIRLV